MKKKELDVKEKMDDRDWERLEKAKNFGLAVLLIPKGKGEPTRGIVGAIVETNDFVEIGDGENFRLFESSDFKAAKIVPTRKLLAEIAQLNQENKELKQVLQRSR